MSRGGHPIVVIGASAGGLETIEEVISSLPPLPASIFIVRHLAPEDTGAALLERLQKYRAFKCRIAKDGESIERGSIYIAPADYHLLVKKKSVLVSKGARENRYRPAIDPLFRSAAVAHGPKVIGIVLTGMLDDGTAGLIAVKKCGGIAVVQDPQDATYPAMPQSVLNNMQVDHCVPAAAMGALLEVLIRKPSGAPKPIPQDIRVEAEIAERVLSDVAQVNGLGSQVPFNCPNCGGVLWEMTHAKTQRYRCHTGHSFTKSTLLTSQTERIEETLWISLRMFEERKNLLNNLVHFERKPGRKQALLERVKEAANQIERIREMLLLREPPNEAGT